MTESTEPAAPVGRAAPAKAAESAVPAAPAQSDTSADAVGPAAPAKAADPTEPADVVGRDAAAPGAERTYAADELFFSTTDARGRIRRANAIFMRLSGYPRGALVGRAHSVVRHEAMPAGLFRSIWEDLEQGRAASAYITNRSADGGFYRVFATIVPSGDGYLSVRTLPMLTRRRDEIEAAYGRVRAVERASADCGSTRREAAAAGHSALLAELDALGFRDAVDFTRQALPAEVAALVAAGVDIPERPDAEGPVAVILDQMNRIESLTSGQVALLDECARIVALLGRRAAEIDDLSARLGRLRTSLRDAVGDAARAGADDGAGRAGGAGQSGGAGRAGGAEDVRERYERVDALVLECVEELRPLAGQVGELRSDADSLRFAIALLRLLNLAAGFFALQILEGEDELEANDAVGSLKELAAALDEGASSLSERVELFEARSELVGVGLDDVAAALAATRAPLLDLLAAVEAGATGAAVEAGATGAAGEADAAGTADAGGASTAGTADAGGAAPVRAARDLVGDGFPEARDLADTAGAVRDLGVPDVSTDLAAHLQRVRAALAELA